MAPLGSVRGGISLNSRFWWDLHLTINHQAQRAGEDYPQQHGQPPSLQPTSVQFTGLPCVPAAPAVHAICILPVVAHWFQEKEMKLGQRKVRLDVLRSQCQPRNREALKVHANPSSGFEYNQWRFRKVWCDFLTYILKVLTRKWSSHLV